MRRAGRLLETVRAPLHRRSLAAAPVGEDERQRPLRSRELIAGQRQGSCGDNHWFSAPKVGHQGTSPFDCARALLEDPLKGDDELEKTGRFVRRWSPLASLLVKGAELLLGSTSGS